MSMKVTVLGSGTCVPRLARSSCALLVEIAGARILLDVGVGTIHRLLAYGLSIFDLTHLFLSHFHPDHSAELVPLIFATKYPDGGRRKHRLQVLAGQGLKGFYKGLQAAYGDWIVLPKKQLCFREIDTMAGETLLFKGFKVTARPVQHRPESLAYRIESADGISMVYSGDTEMCESLVDLAQQTDLFVCESAFPDDHPSACHMTPSLAARVAQRAGVKRLVLTHLYPECDQVDIAKQAAGIYKGPIMVAEDLMSFVLR